MPTAITPRCIAVVAPVHPQVSGGGQFNTTMAAALEQLGPVLTLSWRRLYPPILYRRKAEDLVSRPNRTVHAEELLDWADPRSWRRAIARIEARGAAAVVLPWLHPVMAPPYRYLLRHVPGHVQRVIVCHNVEPHDRVPMAHTLTAAVLRHADLFVTHASHQREELAALGVGDRPVLEAFHPRFPAEDLCAQPTAGEVERERERQGDPELSLLAFGAIRPYKGIDLALQALAKLPRSLRVRLTVAGVFWDGGADLRALARELDLEDRVEFRDGFVSNEEAALLFAAADASILPYRSATQSGVVQMSFAYGVPVIATAVGGLPEAVTDGADGILCRPEDPAALAAAIMTMHERHAELAQGVRRREGEHSFRRYGELLRAAIDALPARLPAAHGAPRRLAPRRSAEATT